MIAVYAIKGPTGRLLKQMLEERGLVSGNVQGIVNYGFGGNHHGVPTLNENAGCQNKYQELAKLADAGVRTVPFSKTPGGLEAPVFGRKLHHTRGTDIFVYNVKPMFHADHHSDYYTQLISKDREFRVWAFRDKSLATYEKVLTYAEKLGRRGRSKEVWNWANGYAYQFVKPELVPDVLKRLAVDSVAALDLDFGAVDIIYSKARRYHVLEVNTAPGVEERRQGITSLVNCIERWAKNGFKPRR